MEETKFINKATVEYLKSQAGSTIQQQLQNLRERIDMESNDLTEVTQNQAIDRDLVNKRLTEIGNGFANVYGNIAQVERDMTILSKTQLEFLQASNSSFDRLDRVIKYLKIAVAVVGVIASCLIVKSLI